MPLTSIATLMHHPEADLAPLEMAIALARRAGAHLHVLCAGIDDTEPGFYYAGAQAVAVQQNLAEARSQGHAVEDIARQRLAAEDILWDVQTVTVMPGGIEPFLADTLRYYDLVVLPTPYQGRKDRIDAIAFESCLFGADTAVMVVPDGYEPEAGFDRIVVGWDGGNQALAAVRAAEPLIKTADLTQVVIVDPPIHAADRSDPGGKLAAYLSRIGAKADLYVVARTQPSVGAQILSRATEQAAGLIVMGAYNHSRMREAILGGTTRDMLRLTTIPLLMAH